jgi:hypothetical protein
MKRQGIFFNVKNDIYQLATEGNNYKYMKVSWKSLRTPYDISLRAGNVKHSTLLVRSL